MADIDNIHQSPVNGGTAAVSSAASPQQATVPGGSPSGAQQQSRPCPKDCRKCSMQQQVCCASMLSFQAFEVMSSIIRRIDHQQHTIDVLTERINAIQNSEAGLSSPVPLQGGPFAGEKQ
jgi:hypothetical protein